MYKGFLIDLDGIAYLGTEVILTGLDFIKRLQQENLKFCFVTNNSTRTNQMVSDHLNHLGYNVTKEHVITSSEVTANFIKNQKRDAKVYMIGMDGLKNDLEQNGLKLVEQGADYVVVGLDFKLTYEKLKIACREIMNGAKFISTNSDLKLKNEEGIVPENGSICKLIECVTGIEPLFIGKPQTAMLAYGLEKLNLQKHEVAMIGDNYLTDILGAINFGIDSIFVETGVMTRHDLEQYAIKPTHIVSDLSEFNNI